MDASRFRSPLACLSFPPPTRAIAHPGLVLFELPSWTLPCFFLSFSTPSSSPLFFSFPFPLPFFLTFFPRCVYRRKPVIASRSLADKDIHLLDYLYLFTPQNQRKHVERRSDTASHRQTIRAMAATYKQFLAAPSSSLLADKASLHYVTTTTSFHGPTDIIKHLNALQKQVKKKHEDVLSLVDGQTAIAVEVDTLLEFQTSGGIYLPGLDDNFLTDREANLAIVRSSHGAPPTIISCHDFADGHSWLDSLRLLRQRGQDCADPPAVGSRVVVEAA